MPIKQTGKNTRFVTRWRVEKNVPLFNAVQQRSHWTFFVNSHQIVVPPLPPQALAMQLPFRNDEGIFSDEFIEERRKGLETFINKWIHNHFKRLVMRCTRNVVFVCALHQYCNVVVCVRYTRNAVVCVCATSVMLLFVCGYTSNVVSFVCALHE